MFGEHEAAGAIPVIPTLRCGPLELHYRTLNSSEPGHFVHSVAGLLFLSCRRCEERDTILRRSMVEVRILPAVLVRAEEARFSIISRPVDPQGSNRGSSFVRMFYVEVWRPDRTPNPIGLGSIPRRRASFPFSYRPRFGAGRRVA